MRVLVTMALAAAVLAGSPLCATALADAYGFQNVTANGGATFASAHNSMFSLNVASAGVNSAGRGLADFTFRVDVTTRPSSICDTYFYNNGTIKSIAGITSSGGVSFSAGASPGHLPGFSGGGFSSLFTADSNSPVSQNGVDRNNEWLTIRLELMSGVNFAQLIQRLNSGAMVVGIHVQAQGGGLSNSYIGTPVLIPLPSALFTGGAGLAVIGLIGCARRRR